MNTPLFRQFISFLFALIIASGCAVREEVLKPSLELSSSAVIASVNALPASINTFTAVGSIDVQTPRMAQTAGFDLALKKPDSIRLVIEGPFGITVGKALLTGTTFKLYNALSNTVYEGDTQKGLNMLPNIDGFSTELLIDAMSGVRRFEDKFVSPDSFYTANNSYALIFLDDTTRIVFIVDGLSLRINEVQTFSATGTLLREESYSYSKSNEGIWHPIRANIIVPEQSVSVEIYFDNVAINPSIEALNVTFPDDADHIIIN